VITLWQLSVSHQNTFPAHSKHKRCCHLLGYFILVRTAYHDVNCNCFLWLIDAWVMQEYFFNWIGYVASDGRMTVEDELERKESSHDLFYEVVSHHSPGDTEENKNLCQSNRSLGWHLNMYLLKTKQKCLIVAFNLFKLQNVLLRGRSSLRFIHEYKSSISLFKMMCENCQLTQV
jgi:hypothetical protein